MSLPVPTLFASADTGEENYTALLAKISAKTVIERFFHFSVARWMSVH